MALDKAVRFEYHWLLPRARCSCTDVRKRSFREHENTKMETTNGLPSARSTTVTSYFLRMV